MDIIVEGVGKKYYKPDEVKINLEFYTKANTYESALEEGTRDVQIFMNDVLGTMNFEKKDLKTRSFRVCEEKKYDYENKIEVKIGFAYTQNATLKFDYDIDFIAEFMDNVSKLLNPPKYTIGFDIKDMTKIKKEVIAEAYNTAKEKAEAIANAAGKTLEECIKIDFKPFDERVYSASKIGNSMFEAERTGYSFGMKKMSAQETITNIFTPEDVEVQETLYCLWITE